MSRIRNSKKTVIFRNPVLFKAIGDPLPPGTYTFTIEEIEIALHGHSIWQVSRCLVPLPRSMLTGSMLGMDVNIDHNELLLRISEDSASK